MFSYVSISLIVHSTFNLLIPALGLPKENSYWLLNASQDRKAVTFTQAMI